MIIQIVGVMYCAIKGYLFRITRIYKNIIIIGILIYVIGFISSKILNNDGDLNIANRGILIISFLYSNIFLISIFKDNWSDFSFTSLLKLFVLITLLQALISFIFFVSPQLGETYRNLVVFNFSSSIVDSISKFRLIGIGDVRYATGAIQYGLMVWAVIALIKLKNNMFANHSLLSGIIITIFCIAGIMSGRVFFVMVLLSVWYIYSLNHHKLFQSTKDFIKFYFPVLLIGIIAFIYLLSQYEELINWAFELFIKYSESGSFESDSTNELKEMYIFPSDIKTWIIGDGKSLNGDIGFYMETDVGYVRSIFYWGLIGSVFYYFSQFYFYKIFKSICNSEVITTYVYFILICFYIYSFKDFYSIDKLLLMFIVMQTMINKHEKKPIKFSIAIPAYKSSFLDEAINSITLQTYQNWELIILDDHSPNNIVSIYKKYSYDTRISYYCNKTNHGAKDIVKNWNICLNIAQGEYFMCIGDDDALFPSCLEIYSHYIEKYPKTDIFHCATEIIDENSDFLRYQESRPLFESSYSMAWHRISRKRDQYIGDFLFKTEALLNIGGFYYQPLGWASDDITTYKCALKNGIINIPNYLFKYRENVSSISNTGNLLLKLKAINMELEWLHNNIISSEPIDIIDRNFQRMIKDNINTYKSNKIISTIGISFYKNFLKTIGPLFMERRKLKLTIITIIYAIFYGMFLKIYHKE